MTNRTLYIVCFFLLLCHKKCLAQSKNDSITFDSIAHNLPEILVKGERPIAVVHGSAITYDLNRMIEKKGVTNIYDAIKELPGVTEAGENFMLANRNVTISLNGKVLSLTSEQMTQFLKSLPASRIDKADVMYSAPAKAHVREALINIRLRKETSNGAPLEGEGVVAYNQQHNAKFGERASILYNKGKFSLDAMFLHSHGKEYQVTEQETHHKLDDGNVYDINNEEKRSVKMFGHDYHVGAEYDFADNHNISFSYQGSYNHRDINQLYTGSVFGCTFTNHRTWLQNARLDYQAPFGLKVGIETTYYHDPENQNLSSTNPNGSLNFIVDNDQRVNTWHYYLSQEHQLKSNWSLNYGIWYRQSVNHSLQYYEGQDSAIYLRQTENVVNVYAGFSKNWNNRFILDASLATEYYNSPQWHKWNLYPTFNLTYVPNSTNVWVLSLTSDRKYPEYWAMNNFTVYSNGGYDEITGNPYLKPAKEYSANLVWVLNNKYQFLAFFNHVDDYFAQTPYIRPDRLVKTYKVLNLNYQQQAGIQAVLPHKFGSLLDARLSLTGVWMHEKCDDYYIIPFNRSIIMGMVQMNNIVTISSKHGLTMTIDGMIRSKDHQAIYDLPGSGTLDLGLSWQFWKKQTILHVFCNDIFETSTVNPRIDYKSQWLRMNFNCYRQFGISLTVKLGGYKAKKEKAIDTSRFRK
ncbi:MAG: outer membrane beta-barrel protein [Prevotella sp.]|nr:outer membrane beta-barrel protein [Prevotella sp.]